MNAAADRVVIGMDPHKRSVTVEVMTRDETVLDRGRFATDRDGAAAMLRFAARWPKRTWAIEGCRGIGRHVANRLLADSEDVVDVPPKVSARARVFATGQGRKTDATDAHSVALVGTRMAGLRPVVNDDQLAVLRILADRRRCPGENHARMVSQLHQLLLELIPGGAKRDLSAAQAKALLARVRRRDAAGKARRRVAAELISDLERIYQRTKAANTELTQLVAATGSTLMDLHGIGPSGAARLLRGRRHRPVPHPRPLRLANGTAPSTPPPATSCDTGSPAPATGRSTACCTSMATVRLRNPTDARAYLDKRKADGTTSMQAMPARKRRLSDIADRRMLDDATSGPVTGPGGHRGTTTDSNGAGSHPHTGTSDKPLPGPARPETTPATAGLPSHSPARSRRPVPAPNRSRRQAQSA
jgi:transposase